MIGIFYFFSTMGYILSYIILLSVRFTTWYNIVALIITVPGFFIYLWTAIRYRRRRRDDEEADEDNVNYENALKVLKMQMNAR